MLVASELILCCWLTKRPERAKKDRAKADDTEWGEEILFRLVCMPLKNERCCVAVGALDPSLHGHCG